jgi:hypothetical protein
MTRSSKYLTLQEENEMLREECRRLREELSNIKKEGPLWTSERSGSETNGTE